jgi:hypothetical protein
MKYNKDIPKIGYQVLVKQMQNNILSDIIVKTQLKLGYSQKAAEVTHVATYIGKGKISEAVFPRARVIDLLEAYRGRYVYIVCPRLTKSGLEYYHWKGRYHIALASNSQNNLKYGLASLFWWPLNFFTKKNWFVKVKKIPFFGAYCSYKEAVAIREEYPERFFQCKPVENVIPADFLGNDFEVVWEGVLPINEANN